MKFRKVLIRAVLMVIGIPVGSTLVTLVLIAVLDRTNGSLKTSGEPRDYLIHVPAHFNPAKPMPLVVSLHGANGWPAQQMNLTRWNRLADEEGFLVVYPAARGLPKVWTANDVDFIEALIDALKVSYPVDPARIYVNGFSQGGSMTFVLACRLSDRVAAVGIVAGAQERLFSWCADPRPLPVITFHGTADPVVAYDGGSNPIGPGTFPALPGWTSDWARRNRCHSEPVDTAVTPTVIRREYDRCAEDASVVLYTIQGGGHQWPGGKPMPEWLLGPAGGSVDATRLMWAFFLAHPRRSVQSDDPRN